MLYKQKHKIIKPLLQWRCRVQICFDKLDIRLFPVKVTKYFYFATFTSTSTFGLVLFILNCRHLNALPLHNEMSLIFLQDKQTKGRQHRHAEGGTLVQYDILVKFANFQKSLGLRPLHSCSNTEENKNPYIPWLEKKSYDFSLALNIFCLLTSKEWLAFNQKIKLIYLPETCSLAYKCENAVGMFSVGNIR